MKNLIIFFFGALFILSGCKRDITNVDSSTSSELNSNVQTSAVTFNKNPISVVYVEVNNNNILNTGCYTLKKSGKQLFDIAIIFAANINYNTSTKKAVLYNNPQVSIVLQNKATYIKPLQDKGIKVMLSVLGNHQGAGISNFTSRAAAKAFAKQLKDTVNFYNLDGIDFDDEFADYGNNGTPQPNDSSFVMLVSALRNLMPNKLITFYYFGPATSSLTYKGVRVGDKADYSWNAIYGSFQVPNVPGLTKAQLAPAAISINSTTASTAKQLATQTINGGYGAYLYYNLTQTPSDKYLSSVSTALYNDSVLLDPDCLKSFPPPPPKDTTGVVFFENENYTGEHTLPIPKGNHTLNDLLQYGFKSNWASSATLPNGWKMRIYYTTDLKQDKGMLITQDTATFGGFYNDFVNSCAIR